MTDELLAPGWYHDGHGSFPPGWHDDGRGSMRWWDGSNWTEHVAMPEAGEPVPPHAAAFIALAEPRKSRLWIVWVVLGVIVLGVVVALAVVIQLLVMALPMGDESGRPSGGSSTEGPTEDVLFDADQQAAVDAVKAYDEAFLTGDCDAFFATTTEAYRAVVEVMDCETLTLISSGLAERIENHVLTIGDVETVGDAVTVSVIESFRSSFDKQGNPTDEPIDYEDHLGYYLVESSGGWAIEKYRIEDEELADDPPANADEQAAVDVVELYGEAWLTADCDSYFETTTEQFRVDFEVIDCESFLTSSGELADSVDNWALTVHGVETLGTAIAVSVTESFTSYFDDEGNETDEPIDHEHPYKYYVVSSNGDWGIDDLLPD